MTKRQPFRMTTQRKLILEEVKKNPTHPSADEVYSRVRKHLPRISLGTVYRNLHILASEGVIQELESAGPQKRFDGNPHPHHHVRCMQCGSLEDVPLRESLSPEDLVLDSKGFEIHGLTLEFTGLCPVCRNARSSAEAAHNNPSVNESPSRKEDHRA